MLRFIPKMRKGQISNSKKTIAFLNKLLRIVENISFLKFYNNQNSMTNVNNTVELSSSVIQSNVIYVQQKQNERRDDAAEHSQFHFQGDEKTFIECVQKMNQEDIQVIETCNINIIGEQIKPGNPKCFILTVLFGLCFIFPLFFFCCEWWKRAVSQVFQINEETYAEIAKILRSKKLHTVTLRIYDNFLTKKKIKILIKSMSKNRIQNLTFINEAGAFDINDEQYANFLSNAKIFLQIRLKKWYIGWYKQYLESQQMIV